MARRRRGIGQRRTLLHFAEALTQAGWTEEQYFALPEVNCLLELSDGKLVVLEMPTPEHQEIVLELAVALRIWVRPRSGRIFVAPMPVRLWPEKVREPDISLFLADRTSSMVEQYAGPPTLAVEVLSPGTRAHDLRVKLREYPQAGIPEYWVVDPRRRTVLVHLLEGEQYRLAARLGLGQVLRSALLPGFELPIDSIFPPGAG
jgi:Uma2 family endonuclease